MEKWNVSTGCLMDYGYKQKLTARYLKSTKYAGELKTSFVFEMPWPIQSEYGTQYLRVGSPCFYLKDYKWCVMVHPQGTDDRSDHLAMFLVNLSDKEAFVSYSLHVKNQGDGADYTYTDPEKMVIFSSKSSGDNEWGDDVIPLSELYEGSNFTKGGLIKFAVDLEVHGRDDLIDNTNIDKVENSNSESELVALADDELSYVIEKLPPKKDAEGQRKLEDRVQRARAK